MNLRQAMNLPRRLLSRLQSFRHVRIMARAQAHSQMRRRGELASASAISRGRFGSLELEAYALKVGENQGLGLSVYIGVEELQRFDCLGEAGHFHINLQQSRWLANGAVLRLSFGSTEIAQQVQESLSRLAKDLPGLKTCNWRERVRNSALSTDQLKAAVSWASAALNDLQIAAQADRPDSTDAAVDAREFQKGLPQRPC